MDPTRDTDFEAYVAAHGHGWERYAYVLTGDPHRAQDLLQTVLLKAFRRWRRICATEHPDAYVRRMVTNSFLDSRRARSSSEIPVESVADDAHHPDPAVGVVDRDELQRGLRRLSPHQRAVLVLRHVEGLPDEDIAGLLGCSVGTVRSHAARGRQRFRAALASSSADLPIPEEPR